MYALIDDRDVGEVLDNVRVVIGEGSGEVSVFVSRLSVTIQSHEHEQRIEIPIPPDDVGERAPFAWRAMTDDERRATAHAPRKAPCKACDERRAAGMGPCAMCGGAMRDPGDMPYDDLVELVRTIQQTMFPGGQQIEWGSGTLGSVGNILDDAGLSPKEVQP